MRTAIDTNVISALWSGEPGALEIAAQLSMARQRGALLLCPAVYAELHAYPGMTDAFLEEFLARTGIVVDWKLSSEVWQIAGQRFAAYASRRRTGGEATPRRLLADFVIAAHGLLAADRLYTLDGGVYSRDFPELVLA